MGRGIIRGISPRYQLAAKVKVENDTSALSEAIEYLEYGAALDLPQFNEMYEICLAVSQLPTPPDLDDYYEEAHDCGDCHGTGYLTGLYGEEDEVCEHCNGEGIIAKEVEGEGESAYQELTAEYDVQFKALKNVQSYFSVLAKHLQEEDNGPDDCI